jgi:hypothetical protein
MMSTTADGGAWLALLCRTLADKRQAQKQPQVLRPRLRRFSSG